MKLYYFYLTQTRYRQNCSYMDTSRTQVPPSYQIQLVQHTVTDSRIAFKKAETARLAFDSRVDMLTQQL